MIYITGDTHGNFSRIINFCDRFKDSLSKNDIMIVLGDAGINYYLDSRDKKLKRKLENLPITIFSIHGNHEARPETIETYKTMEWHNGLVYVEEAFPSILFAKDGEVYSLGDYGRVLAIGGAYSVDKFYRLMRGFSWFEDEQPSQDTKDHVEEVIRNNNGKFDIILTHTAPVRYEPIEWFLEGLDQSKVDKSTEEWLDKIYNMVDFNKWYCGHYHGDKTVKDQDKIIRFMFQDIDLFE